MARQKTAPVTLPDYLHSIISYLEENGQYLGFAEGEWVIKTANRRLVISAPSLEELADELKNLASGEEEEVVDWVDDEEEVVELDVEALEEEDDDEEDDWDDEN